MMDKKLEVKNLQISFKTQGGKLKAVRDISFDLYKGETLAIVGESGSGKSVTSKAIIGILARNAIVEGGEILYEGGDLLRISEDDFHKIRGDKIAMIFQDPLSSLNPIMKVGRQLTEAMILKAKTTKRKALHNFNEVIKKLQLNSDKDSNQVIDTFKEFCLKGTKHERGYNEVIAHLIGLEDLIENTIFLINKSQLLNIKKVLKEVKVTLNNCYHPFLLTKDDMPQSLINQLDDYLAYQNEVDNQKILACLNELKEVVVNARAKEKPNFFSLGYYLMKNPKADIYSIQISELNQMTTSFLNENFMESFIILLENQLKNAHDKSIELKRRVLIKAKELISLLHEKKESKKVISHANQLSQLVRQAIDPLSIEKITIEYSFSSSIRQALNNYYQGLINNPLALEKYQKQENKYNKLIAQGKVPDWKLIPPLLIDLDLAYENIIKLVTSLINSTEQTSLQNFMPRVHANALIDYLKIEASKIVLRVTPKMAKARALKLLEEVGIPEPRLRYNQYPFEFSGGMRQRIVIAIALSANPDILICDEPTTALDVTIQAQILELINKLKTERNLSIIFITHNLGVVANMADRVAVMYAGKIVEIGLSDEVFYDPRHPYTWALLSSMPDLRTKGKLEAIPGTPPNMIFPPKGDAFAQRNKYAMKIDFDKHPPFFEVSKTHFAATWLLHPLAPKALIPEIIQERINRMKKELGKDNRNG